MAHFLIKQTKNPQLYVPVLNHSGRRDSGEKMGGGWLEGGLTGNLFKITSISFHYLYFQEESIALFHSNWARSQIKRFPQPTVLFILLLNFVVNTKCYFPSCEVRLAAASANQPALLQYMKTAAVLVFTDERRVLKAEETRGLGDWSGCEGSCLPVIRLESMPGDNSYRTRRKE